MKKPAGGVALNPERPAPSPHGLPAWVIIIAGVLLFAQFVLRAEDSLTRESPTWDENMHMNYGLNFLRLGPTFPAGDHPYPFVALLTLPLALTDPGPGDVSGLWRNPETGGFAQIRTIESPSNLFPARRMNVAVAALGLLLASLWIGRRYGTGIGLGFAALGSLDPAWMASARYITTDIAQGLAFLLGSLALVRLRETGRLKPLLVAGLALGLALTAKASGLVMIPCVFVFGLLPGPEAASRAYRFKRAITWSATVAATGIIAYLSLFFIHAALGLAPWDAGVVHLREALYKFMQIRAVDHGTFLMGGFFPTGTRLYFPALTAAKTPLALAAIVITPLFVRRARLWVRRHADLLVVPGVFLAAAIASGVNLGYRHLTPVLPAFWILGAAGMAGMAGNFRPGRWIAPAATALLAIEIGLAHPHYLQFTNAAFGGVNNAWNIAVDSATDWGQDLPLLRAWLTANPPGKGPVHLAYFGTADPAALGIPYVWMPCKPLGRPRPPDFPASTCDAPAEILAVSATCLQGAAGGTVRDTCYSRLRKRAPDAVLGGTILIYRDVMPEKQPSAAMEPAHFLNFR